MITRTINIDLNSRVSDITIGEFIELIRRYDSQQQPQVIVEQTKNYVHGLAGIMGLFGVSRTMAQKYKDSWLAPAIMQRGKTIVCDADLAMQLFEQKNQKFQLKKAV